MGSTTEAVVRRHLDALMARDLDRLMEDYAEEAFFISNLVFIINLNYLGQGKDT